MLNNDAGELAPKAARGCGRSSDRTRGRSPSQSSRTEKARKKDRRGDPRGREGRLAGLAACWTPLRVQLAGNPDAGPTLRTDVWTIIRAIRNPSPY